MQIATDAAAEQHPARSAAADRRPSGSATRPSKLYFTRLSRDQHRLDVVVADTATGDVKTLIEERLNTYVESKPLRLVNGGTELIFWSERDGWGHFYLYDAATGALKNRITEGEFVATAIEGVDDKARVLYLSAGGREKGEDPYYTHLYRVGFDGTGLKLLNPGDASHSVSVTESAKFFVDNASRVNGAPESALYDTLGNRVLKLETPDLAPLTEAGFKFPEPFTVKADDGITDLYGVMYKPFDFDPSRKYPIIAFVYPGPQTESVTKTFNPRSNNISLAQFGFIVIEVGNRGGHPQRSKWYHNYGYGNLRDYGLADKKAAIEQLAKRHSFIDINRVGIWGHSGGGFMSAAAMLVYPGLLQGGVVGVRQPREQHLQQQLEREAPRHQGDREGRQGHLRVRHREELGAGEEPEGPPDADHRRHRQQRASGEHLSAGRRADQGEQALRHVRAARRAPLVPAGVGLRQLAARRLLRAPPAGPSSETSTSSSSIARGSRRATRSRAEQGERALSGQGAKSHQHRWRCLPSDGLSTCALNRNRWPSGLATYRVRLNET